MRPEKQQVPPMILLQPPLQRLVKIRRHSLKNLLTDDNLEATIQTSAQREAIGTQEMTASYRMDTRTKLAVEVASRLKNKARLY